MDAILAALNQAPLLFWKLQHLDEITTFFSRLNSYIKSSQNTKTESSEYQIKRSENDQIKKTENTQTKKPSQGTDLPKSSKPAPPSTSVSLHGEKTQVVSGEDILLRLSAVNLITKPLMHVQVIIIPPSGMSVSSSEFVQSGARQYTTTYDLDPGQGQYFTNWIRKSSIPITISNI